MWFFALLSCAMFAGVIGGPADPADTEEIVVEVPKGTTARAVGSILANVGAIEDADSFTLYVRLTKEGGCLKAGRHKVARSMSAGEILEQLCGAPVPDDVPFTVLEGWRIREIDAALARQGLIQPGEYKALVSSPAAFTTSFPLPSTSLEGYLYPETYNVVADAFDPKAFVQRQLDTFWTRFASKHPSGFGERSLADVVIMASMIVREEPTPKNRPMVAGILWKRIDNQWNLGVDATSRYTLSQWNDRRAFLKKLRDPGDPYNTRLRSGLPPTAIGNPDLSSLEAAANATESPYWYYLHDSSGKLHPSRSVQQHEAARRKYNVY